MQVLWFWDFDIFDWIRSLLFSMCTGIYQFCGSLYNFIMQLASMEIFSDEIVATAFKGVYSLLGIVMIFVIAIALVRYIVNPDAISDKKMGLSKIVSGVVISFLILIIFPYVFTFTVNLQNAILFDGTLADLFSPGIVQQLDDYNIKLTKCDYGNNTEFVYSINSDDSYAQRAFVANWSKMKDSVRDNKNGTNVTLNLKLSVWNFSTITVNGDNLKNSLGKEFISLLFSQEPMATITYDEKTDLANGCPQYAYVSTTPESSGWHNRYLLNWILPWGTGFALNAKLSDENRRSDKQVIAFSEEKIDYLDQNDAIYELKTLKNEEPIYYSWTAGTGAAIVNPILLNFMECNPSVKGLQEAFQEQALSQNSLDILSVRALLACYQLDAAKNSGYPKAASSVLNAQYNDDDDGYAIVFNSNGFLPLVVGIVLLAFFAVTCFDVALRTIKIAFLRILAPIPIMAYASPNTRQVFSNWLKTFAVTYLDLFIRLIVLFFLVFVVKEVKIIQSSFWLTLFVIIGLLMFAKMAPQFIGQIFGIKDLGGKFTLNPFQKLRETPLFGGLMGAGAGFAGGMMAGKKVGFRGAIAGGLAGAKSGFSNSGGMRGLKAGEKPKNGSYGVGSQTADKFIKGQGGFMSRTMGNKIRDKETSTYSKAKEARNAYRDKIIPGLQEKQMANQQNINKKNLRYQDLAQKYTMGRNNNPQKQATVAQKYDQMISSLKSQGMTDTQVKQYLASDSDNRNRMLSQLGINSASVNTLNVDAAKTKKNAAESQRNNTKNSRDTVALRYSDIQSESTKNSQELEASRNKIKALSEKETLEQEKIRLANEGKFNTAEYNEVQEKIKEKDTIIGGSTRENIEKDINDSEAEQARLELEAQKARNELSNLDQKLVGDEQTLNQANDEVETAEMFEEYDQVMQARGDLEASYEEAMQIDNEMRKAQKEFTIAESRLKNAETLYKPEDITKKGIEDKGDLLSIYNESKDDSNSNNNDAI